MRVEAPLFTQKYFWKCVGLTILFALQLSCFVYSTYDAASSQRSDEELGRLEPQGVAELFWQAALKGDTETIKTIVGRPGDSMRWDCPREVAASDRKATVLANTGVSEEAVEAMSDKPVDNLESILRYARITEIARKPLETHYDLAEYRSSGPEARLLYRPKDSPNSTNSTVFFLLRDGRWRIVDIKSENHLQFVGNKKFGERRECQSGQH
jgi:hypothetical protein